MRYMWSSRTGNLCCTALLAPSRGVTASAPANGSQMRKKSYRYVPLWYNYWLERVIIIHMHMRFD